MRVKIPPEKVVLCLIIDCVFGWACTTVEKFHVMIEINHEIRL